MKILITGGFGFIGKHLIARLSSPRVGLTIISSQVTKSNRDFASNLSGKVNIIEGNLASIDLGSTIVTQDIVIHLAWSSNPAISGLDTGIERSLNWDPSNHLIQACAKENVKLVFLSSGGTVYGNFSTIPIDENHPTNPISAYGKMKLAVEKEIIHMHETSGMPYLILRPSNAYGTGYALSKGYGVISFWVEQFKRNEPIAIMGDGSLKRDFIYVDDLVSGIIASLDLQNDIFNIASGKSVSLNELKLLFERVGNQSITVKYLPGRDYDIKDNCLSIKKIKNATGWTPKVPIEEGLKRLL